MSHRLFKLILLTTVALPAWAEYRVDSRELDALERDIQSIDRDLQDVMRRSGGGHPRPGGGIQNDLQRISEKVSGRRGLLDWVRDVRRGGGHGGPGGGSGGPGGGPGGPGHGGGGQNLLSVTGFYVVGRADTKDYAEAARSHAAECSRLETFLRQELGATLDIFECGATSNVSQYPNIGYTQLASTPKIQIRVARHINARSTTSAPVAGTTDAKDSFAAYDSWIQACMQVLRQEKAKYGNRFIAASCGNITNVTKYPNIGYKQFYSTGTVYIE